MAGLSHFAPHATTTEEAIVSPIVLLLVVDDAICNWMPMNSLSSGTVRSYHSLHFTFEARNRWMEANEGDAGGTRGRRDMQVLTTRTPEKLDQPTIA